ncbi:MAG: choice-of-anchor B family protein [Bacteroidetes bacterium]|nr:choice-of-anchor B family protein [Bacteroidota bacterium]
MSKKCLLTIIGLWLSFQLHAQLNTAFQSQLTFPGKTLANLWGYTDSLNREFALVGTTTGMSIVNVTNPTTPVLLFNISGVNSQWREVKTHGKYAYVTTEGGGGLQIVNLSYLPDSAPSKLWTGNGAIAGLSRIHALHIDNGFVYLYGCRDTVGSNLFNGAALICSLSDPWNPNFVGHTSTGVSTTVDYIHDGEVVDNKFYGGHIYAGKFSIYDVTNKAAPVLINKQTTPNAFCHNTWTNNARTVLFTTDEVSNSYLGSYNISDPNNIVFLDKIQSQNPGSGSIIHNTYQLNDYCITSYYRDGFTIVDVTRPSNMILTGWYDTSPLSGNGFNGAWGVYPYFPSGNIAVSDMENGLFMIAPTYTRGCYLEGIVTDTLTGLSIAGATVQIVSTTASDVSVASGEYKTGLAAAGTYSVIVTKAGYETKTINNVVLTNGVLTTLNVQLSTPKISISGTVYSATGLPISAATVRIESATAGSFSALCNSSGQWTINSVYQANYSFYAGKWGSITKCVPATFNTINTTRTDTLGVGFYDDFTFVTSWKPSNNAKRGKWVRAKPIGTTYLNPNDANPASDYFDDFTNWCYVTGNNGGSYNFDDVDNGYVNLNSPAFNLSTYTEPYINYARWVFIEPGSNDSVLFRLTKSGVTVNMETFTAASSGQSVWQYVSLRVKDYFGSLGSMRFSVYARDNAPEHAIESALDKFSITEGPSPGIANPNYNVSRLSNGAAYAGDVFPNPANNMLNIRITGEIDTDNPVTITIYDVNGKVLLQRNGEQAKTVIRIAVESLSAGLYMVRVASGEKVFTSRFMKQ